MTEEHKDAGANKYQNASLTQQEIDASRTTEFSALSERIRSVLLGWTRYFDAEYEADTIVKNTAINIARGDSSRYFLSLDEIRQKVRSAAVTSQVDVVKSALAKEIGIAAIGYRGSAAAMLGSKAVRDLVKEKAAALIDDWFELRLHDNKAKTQALMINHPNYKELLVDGVAKRMHRYGFLYDSASNKRICPYTLSDHWEIIYCWLWSVELVVPINTDGLKIESTSNIHWRESYDNLLVHQGYVVAMKMMDDWGKEVLIEIPPRSAKSSTTTTKFNNLVKKAFSMEERIRVPFKRDMYLSSLHHSELRKTSAINMYPSSLHNSELRKTSAIHKVHEVITIRVKGLAHKLKTSKSLSADHIVNIGIAVNAIRTIEERFKSEFEVKTYLPDDELASMEYGDVEKDVKGAKTQVLRWFNTVRTLEELSK